MGTRHLIRIIDSTGIIRAAQYGQWDGYPSGQGVDLLEHMHDLGFASAETRAEFDSALQNTVFVNDEDIEIIDKRIKEQGLTLSKDLPAFSRDTSADLLPIIMSPDRDGMAACAFDRDDKLRLQNSITFGVDTVMCEWVYEINMSALDGVGTFSVRRDDESPVIATFRLDQLPDRATFLAMVEETANALYEED